MSINTCNANKAASAIFNTTRFDAPMNLSQFGDGEYPFIFNTTFGKIGQARVSVSAKKDTVTIEANLPFSNPLHYHPCGSCSIELLANESNDSFVNAAKLALAGLDKIVAERTEILYNLYNDTIVEKIDGYELSDGTEIGGTPAEVLDCLLNNDVPQDMLVEYKSNDKYDKIDLHDIDVNKVSAVYNFFLDLTWDEHLYINEDEVYSVGIESVRDAVNWALKKAKSTQIVDSNTVIAALMAGSLNTIHDIFERPGVFGTEVLVPMSIMDLIACSKMIN